MSHNDTIVAQATPPGRGGVGILRISGLKAREVAEAVLGKLPKPRYADYLPFKDSDGTPLDQGIALWFPGPNSFTGEDVLELQGHGGPVILDLLLKRILTLPGLRIAKPGEFSERAFLNDKLDLAQAEAIADLIDASSEQAARSALNSLQGAFSARVNHLVEALTHLRIYVEAAIDFPDEEIDFLSDGKIEAQLNQVMSDLDAVRAEARQGSLLREGMKVVIAGRPNAGKSSLLNKTIFHLMPCAEQKLTICTPYFNLPAVLVRNIIQLLRDGKKVEIIVGDKTANDFFIPEDQPFKIIGALPYLYEINLRRFLSRLQYYVNTDQLVVRLWKDEDNSYHLKGMWVDDEWMLLTGNNLNPRAWRLDLENAILIHDPQHELAAQRERELELIRTHTTVVNHYRELQSIADYPVKVRKLIRRLRRIRIDRLISRIL